MQMRHHHMGDLLRCGAGRNHPFTHQRVEHVHARNTGAGLEVAHAGIDDDDVVARMHDPELDRHNQLVHVRDPVVWRHQVHIRIEHGPVEVRKEKGRIMRRPSVLENSGDFYVTKGA